MVDGRQSFLSDFVKISPPNFSCCVLLNYEHGSPNRPLTCIYDVIQEYDVIMSLVCALNYEYLYEAN